MNASQLKLTYIGGPTALLEFGGLRLLTDPTFDAPGGEYTTGPVTLRKIMGPALGSDAIGLLDAVLLTHDHHFDNLDHAGRALLGNMERVFTTKEGALRLGRNVIGLAAWDSVDLQTHGGALRVTATPAQHGPADSDRGPVIGFILASVHIPEEGIYISGDTVWFEGVAEVARRFEIHTVVLFMGAARVPAVGSHHLTMTATEGTQVAHAFPRAMIVPLHFEGWAHFSESREVITRAFDRAGLTGRLQWPELGRTISIARQSALT